MLWKFKDLILYICILATAPLASMGSVFNGVERGLENFKPPQDLNLNKRKDGHLEL